MPDEPEFDLNEIMTAHIRMAEVVWAYHQALISAGFAANEALTLTMEYQRSLLSVSFPT